MPQVIWCVAEIMRRLVKFNVLGFMTESFAKVNFVTYFVEKIMHSDVNFDEKHELS